MENDQNNPSPQESPAVFSNSAQLTEICPVPCCKLLLTNAFTSVDKYEIRLVRVEVKVGLFGNAKRKSGVGVRRLDKKKNAVRG